MYPTQGRLKWRDIVLPVEWTITNEKVSARLDTKLRQAVFNAAALLVEQPERNYVLTLAICKDRCYLIMLDAECIRIATIGACWTSGLNPLAAVIHYLANLDLISAGFSPLFGYAHTPAKGIHASSLAPSLAAVLPDSLRSHHSLHLLHSPYPQQSPFSRATTIYAISSETSIHNAPVLLKLQNVADQRIRREAEVLEEIMAADLPEEDDCYLTKLLHAFVFDTLPYQSSHLPSSSEARHLEVLFLHNEPATIATRLDNPDNPPSIFDVLNITRHLLLLLVNLWTHARVLHRDLSPANVLHRGLELVLIDWDCGIGRRLSERLMEAAGTRTGTLETMAREVLDGPVQHKLRHDLESVLYLLSYWLWSGLAMSSEEEEKLYWQKWRFGEEGVSVLDIRAARGQIWDVPNQKMVLRAFGKFSPGLAIMMKDLLKLDPTSIGDDDGDAESESVELARAWAAAITSTMETIKQESMSVPSWVDNRWWKVRSF